MQSILSLYFGKYHFCHNNYQNGFNLILFQIVVKLIKICLYTQKRIINILLFKFLIQDTVSKHDSWSGVLLTSWAASSKITISLECDLSYASSCWLFGGWTDLLKITGVSVDGIDDSFFCRENCDEK